MGGVSMTTEQIICLLVTALLASVMINIIAFNLLITKIEKKIKQYAYVNGDIILTLNDDNYIKISYKELKEKLKHLVERYEKC